MIKMYIETTEVAGFKSAINGMRNPMNSWDKNDSFLCYDTPSEEYKFIFGENDLDLAQRLIKAGGEHCKFLRQIQVWCNMYMSRYFWSEFDTYKFNTKNSCSTMHKLLNKDNPITLDMFEYGNGDEEIFCIIIDRLNKIREQFLNATDQKEKDCLLLRAKRLLPEGLLQLRTVNTNYAELRNIYFQRRNHRLKEEWINTFCKWVETLPYAKELIMLET